MRHKKEKINLIRDEGTAAGPVSSLSDEEQARFGNFADVALNHKVEPTSPLGSRAHQAHENLKQELLDTLEQLKREKTDAA